MQHTCFEGGYQTFFFPGFGAGLMEANWSSPRIVQEGLSQGGTPEASVRIRVRVRVRDECEDECEGKSDRGGV